MSFRKRYEAQKKREAIKSLKLIMSMIQSGDYVVLEQGMWAGLDGKQNFKIIVKDSNFQTVSGQNE